MLAHHLKRTITLFILLPLFSPAWSQEIVTVDRPVNRKDFPVVHYRFDDGKTDFCTLRILQDGYGFMWFGTFNSLVCFDGYNYKVYNTERPGETGFKGAYIGDIAEDRDGNIWVGTTRGLNKLNRHNGQFSFYQPDTVYYDSPDNHIRSIYIDTIGFIWLITGHNYYWMDPGKGNFTKIIIDSLAWLDPNPAYMWFSTMLEDKFAGEGTKRMWIATINGLMRCDRENNESRVFTSEKTI